MSPGQSYSRVEEAIKGISGRWAKIHQSVWFVQAPLTAEEVRNRVWAVMDKNDKVFVVDAFQNSAAWQNLDAKVSQYLVSNWSQRPV